jgi:hypothetical protein
MEGSVAAGGAEARGEGRAEKPAREPAGGSPDRRGRAELERRDRHVLPRARVRRHEPLAHQQHVLAKPRADEERVRDEDRDR